jgi:L,D-transpeptidase YcbB
MFPNAHSVYLHDTNDRGLFDRAERNLSSGCVRIEHPFALADLLLGESPGWSPQRRDEILDSGRTTRIDLPRPMPIVLTYYTAWVDETGTLQFREDVYARDQAVLAALDDIVRLGRPVRSDRWRAGALPGEGAPDLRASARKLAFAEICMKAR